MRTSISKLFPKLKFASQNSDLGAFINWQNVSIDTHNLNREYILHVVQACEISVHYYFSFQMVFYMKI